MGASDFRSPPPSSSLFRLVRRCALLPTPTIGSPWLPRTLVVRLDADSDPGVAPRACQCARDAVVCWPIETIDQFTHLTISGLIYLQGQHHLFPLHLASFCAYASSLPLPECLQGSIPGPWLAVTWAGFTPARPRSIAKPQPMAGLRSPLRRFAHSSSRTGRVSRLGEIRCGLTNPSSQSNDQPQLLQRPVGARVGGHVHVRQTARAVLDDNKHVQQAKRCRYSYEEVARENRLAWFFRNVDQRGSPCGCPGGRLACIC